VAEVSHPALRAPLAEPVGLGLDELGEETLERHECRPYTDEDQHDREQLPAGVEGANLPQPPTVDTVW
jgi:hypothetical protein